MNHLTTLALRVHNMDRMVQFYGEAFGFRFHPVETNGFQCQFGESGSLLLKLVPIRDSADFAGYPVHQPGFRVPDTEHVVALAIRYGGRQEGEAVRTGDGVQVAVRDPDGNTVELYGPR